MKPIQIKPVILAPAVIIIVLGSFLAGDTFHGQFPNPFRPVSTGLDMAGLGPIYDTLKQDFDGTITPQEAIDGAKAGLVQAGGDPYTTYLTPTQAKDLQNDLNGKLSGIGAEIGLKNNAITIIAPINDTPAARAGLKAGDVIARINNEDTTGMTVDTAVSKIRGPKDTKVTLTILRTGQDRQDITITRAEINVPSVKWELKNGHTGLITISRFGADTADLMGQAATRLKSQGATNIVLDLRNNPGGYLDAGVAVASQFLPQDKLIVEERSGGKTKDKLSSSGGGQLVGLPTIVLINQGSASASEIVAGALHDNNAAHLVGETSFGKGSVQEIKNLPGGAELKVTVAHWYTPNGVNIGKSGIKPDTEVKLTTDDYNASRDPQLDKALDLLK